MQRDSTSKYSRSVRGFLPGRQRLRSSFANEHSQGARWLILSSGRGGPSPPRASFNDLIRSQQQWRRNRETERLGGLQIDREAHFRRLFDRKVAWLRAF